MTHFSDFPQEAVYDKLYKRVDAAMNVNFPERIWCNSRLRQLVQRREVNFWKTLHALSPGGRFLEIGCGNGAGALLLIETFAPGRLHALDSDPAMLRLAAKRRDKSATASDRLGLLQGDAQHLPFSTASMDAAFNFGIIHHLEDWRQGIRELARVLKTGGSFFFEEIFPPLYANCIMKRLVLHPTENRFHGPEFKQALEESGLELQPGFKESRFGLVGVALKH